LITRRRRPRLPEGSVPLGRERRQRKERGKEGVMVMTMASDVAVVADAAVAAGDEIGSMKPEATNPSFSITPVLRQLPGLSCCRLGTPGQQPLLPGSYEHLLGLNSNTHLNGGTNTDEVLPTEAATNPEN